MEFPGHARVNHVTYIVTGRRANIGTVSMTDDYFHAISETSLNASHPTLVAKLQQRFDRDWDAAIR